MGAARLHRVAAIAVVLAATACGAPTSPGGPTAAGGLITLRTDTTEYRDGGLVGLAIRNNGGEGLSYNACLRTLERWVDTMWVAMPPSLRLCTREVNRVLPGAARTDSTALDPGLDLGEYRLLLVLTPELRDIALIATSNSFFIIP